MPDCVSLEPWTNARDLLEQPDQRRTFACLRVRIRIDKGRVQLLT